MSTKKCIVCKEDKDKSDFYTREAKCKECKKQYQKELLQHNRDSTKLLKEKIDKIRDINDQLIESNLEKDLEIKRLNEEINKLKIEIQKK
jgi:recombinational DNA repair protein (RecF pathway)